MQDFLIVKFFLKKTEVFEMETYDKIVLLVEEFSVNHEKFINDKNKSAGTRARKAIGEIKKIATEYRKQSTELAKSY